MYNLLSSCLTDSNGSISFKCSLLAFRFKFKLLGQKSKELCDLFFDGLSRINFHQSLPHSSPLTASYFSPGPLLPLSPLPGNPITAPPLAHCDSSWHFLWEVFLYRYVQIHALIRTFGSNVICELWKTSKLWGRPCLMLVGKRIWMMMTEFLSAYLHFWATEAILSMICSADMIQGLPCFTLYPRGQS